MEEHKVSTPGAIITILEAAAWHFFDAKLTRKHPTVKFLASALKYPLHIQKKVFQEGYAEIEKHRLSTI